MPIERTHQLRACGVLCDFSRPADLSDFGRHNLVYGWHGTGKTTLSRLFRSLELRRPPTVGDNGVLRTYAWGLDLSGSAWGAGGVGGLVFECLAKTDITHHLYHDGNGNVTSLRDGAGAVSAAYEYGPFGETLTARGDEGAIAYSAFTISTKYADAEIGLLYYSLRCYNPGTGRRLSKDLLDEEGGVPLGGFVGHRPPSNVAPPGLEIHTREEATAIRWVPSFHILAYTTDAMDWEFYTYYLIMPFNQTRRAFDARRTERVPALTGPRVTANAPPPTHIATHHRPKRWRSKAHRGHAYLAPKIHCECGNPTEWACGNAFSTITESRDARHTRYSDPNSSFAAQWHPTTQELSEQSAIDDIFVTLVTETSSHVEGLGSRLGAAMMLASPSYIYPCLTSRTCCDGDAEIRSDMGPLPAGDQDIKRTSRTTHRPTSGHIALFVSTPGAMAAPMFESNAYNATLKYR